MTVGDRDDLVAALLEEIAAAQFNADEIELVRMVVERVKRGRATYGALHSDRDPRDFAHEMLEEQVDAAAYGAIELIRLVRARRMA